MLVGMVPKSIKVVKDCCQENATRKYVSVTHITIWNEIIANQKKFVLRVLTLQAQ